MPGLAAAATERNDKKGKKGKKRAVAETDNLHAMRHAPARTFETDNPLSASRSQMRGLPQSFYCPITSELMVDPVMDPQGNSYEHSTIENCTVSVHVRVCHYMSIYIVGLLDALTHRASGRSRPGRLGPQGCR